MLLFLGFIILAYQGPSCSFAAVTYDQRQTGETNVQIELKDVQILALIDSDLFDDYTDYDYAYDYADFTIRPINKPTNAPSSTSSVKPWYTWPTNPPSLASNNASVTASSTEEQPILNATVAPPTSNANITENGAASDGTGSTTEKSTSLQNSTEKMNPVQMRINNKTGGLFSDEDIIDGAKKSTLPLTSAHETDSEGQNRRRCQPGYSRDKKGRCRRIIRRRLSFLPMAMRLASRIVPTKNTLNQQPKFDRLPQE
ncbi:uncharacterized protein LOC107271121 [Cephus cinctus]|uniref:Uncharacterized protein LOC107271121 n=1 Tax=Cephus cinctus TaxID=211228 RepID=A0AAJ7FPQ9_CEPCN|nr:uncharacterized protein LOC107271121 [Cephus cinctus]